MRTCQKTFLLLVLLSFPAVAAQPEGFTFTKILEASGALRFGAGALNDRGTVVVNASTPGVGDTILVADGRTLSIVAETASINSFGRASITNQGDVIFRAGNKILLSRKGRLSTLVGGGTVQGPVVNRRGAVAYLTFLTFSPDHGVYAAVALDHGETTVITTFLRPILVFGINQRGQVLAMTDPGRPSSSLLLVGDGRTTRVVADASVDLHSGFFFEAVINDQGTVAFSAYLGDDKRSIFLADPQGGITPFVTNEGLFDFFTLAGLTHSGTPVFTASLDTGGRGVFVGPDPVADKVVATGDTLDGATVTSASVVDVNASGQLLIWVSFEGRASALYRIQHGGVH
jgi:hypothetical protein